MRIEMGSVSKAALAGALALAFGGAVAGGRIALAQAGGGGTITGKVDVLPIKNLEETVVYLKDVPGTHAPKTEKMDQKGMRFLPHVMAISVGDTVEFTNSDAVDHNVYSPENETFNLGTFPPHQSRKYTFKKTGADTILCSIHPEMLAYVFVGQNPHSATVNKSGQYTLHNVPPGTYKLAVWNSHGKAPDQTVTVAAGKTVQANFTVKK